MKYISLLIQFLKGSLTLASITGKRKVVLIDIVIDGNYHQFYRFGGDVLSILHSQVSDVANAHAWYVGLTPATSKEMV